MPDHVYGSIEVESSSMLKKLVVVLGLVAGLSACAGPYDNTGYGYNEPAYYGYSSNTPVYYGPGYYPPHTSQHGTVQY
jgi:hypothetical protein